MEDNYLATPSELAIAIGKARAQGPVTIIIRHHQAFGPLIDVVGEHTRFVKILIPEIRKITIKPFIL